MKVLISPYSQKLRNGNPNPKNYAYWNELIALLATNGYKSYQLSREDEVPLKRTIRLPEMSIKDIPKILKDYDFFISVDSFLPHLAAYYNYPGVVIWSQSDPQIFGYDIHLNILKDRKYLRPDQFHIWEQAKYNSDAYAEPEYILKKIQERW